MPIGVFRIFLASSLITTATNIIPSEKMLNDAPRIIVNVIINLGSLDAMPRTHRVLESAKEYTKGWRLLINTEGSLWLIKALAALHSLRHVRCLTSGFKIILFAGLSVGTTRTDQLTCEGYISDRLR